MTKLQLVKSDRGSLSCDGLPIKEVDRKSSVDAQLVEAWLGNNTYSNFVKKNGKRPSRDQASVIGILMEAHVLDDENSHQPPLKRTERTEILERRQSKKLRLQSRRAVSVISKVADCGALAPSDVVLHSSLNLDIEAIRAQLQAAVSWLQRVDTEFEIRENEIIRTARCACSNG